MKLSIMMFPFFRPLRTGAITPEALMEQLKSWGVGGIEPMLSHDEQDLALARRVQAAREEAGLVNVCLDRSVNLIGAQTADREAALDICKRALELAVEVMHSPLVMLHGTRPSEGMSDEDGVKIYGEQLRKAGELAKGTGVHFCIEDFGMFPPFSATIAMCRAIMDYAGPEVGFTFDNGNFLIGDDVPMDAFPVLQDRFLHVHIKGFKALPSGRDGGCVSPKGVHYVDCQLDDGDAQVGECIRRLKAIGYQGWLSLEAANGTLEYSRVATAFMRKCWN